MERKKQRGRHKKKEIEVERHYGKNIEAETELEN
jgi:hypothetical protein